MTKIRVVTLTEDETMVLVYAHYVTDEQIIQSIFDQFLSGMMGDIQPPKTVEDFNALGTFEMQIEEQNLLIG